MLDELYPYHAVSYSNIQYGVLYTVTQNVSQHAPAIITVTPKGLRSEYNSQYILTAIISTIKLR